MINANGSGACEEELPFVNATLVNESYTPLFNASLYISYEEIVKKFDPRGWVVSVPIFLYAFEIQSAISSLTHPVKQKKYIHWLLAAVFATSLSCFMCLGIIVGKLGKENAEFSSPNGLRVSKNNELYVCDSYNNRVQVFDLDLNFKRSFGKKGTGRGQFDFPADVNFDSVGNIYVTDPSKHRIQVFSPHSEHHIYTIKEDAVFRPVSLFTHGNHMYVTDAGHNEVRVIDTESREFISKFGNGYLHKPEGITIDEDGFVYVTSHHSKIVIF